MSSNYRLLALKCKIISLGLESKCIRAQELRVTKQWHKLVELAASKNAEPNLEYLIEFEQNLRHIHQHRVDDVRLETRLAHWAYAFLRGQSHEKVESCPGDPVSAKDVDRLERMVASFSGYFGMPPGRSAEFKEWVSYAQSRCHKARGERLLREEETASRRAKRREALAEQRRHIGAA